MVICIPKTRIFMFEDNIPFACIKRPTIRDNPEMWIIKIFALLYSKANKSNNAIGIYSIAFDCVAMASFNSSFPPSPTLTN